MAKNTNLNVSPYFDDFDESKNYNKVLFKPGYPVQARELTTSQSIVQNQIEKLGHYFFKEGSVVVPGGTTYDSVYDCVRIDPVHLTLPVSAYTKVLVDNNIKIKGETTGVTATVINRLTVSDSIDKFDTLYIKYNSSGTDGITKTFQDGENLITLSDINYSSTKVEANGTFAKCIETGSTKTGASVSINEGLYYIRGFFVHVPKSTVILDQYTNRPSYKIGLAITEKIVQATSVNSDLYDNAQGFANESAPGADRFSVSAKLSKKLLTDPEDKNFIELIRIENGIIKKFDPSTDPKFNLFEDALAKRTYEESGNYYVRPFSIDIRESLNNRINNRGLYFENQLTQNTNTPSDDIYCLQMSAGKAYVNGYRIAKEYSCAVDVLKPRTKKDQENKSLPIKVGNVLKVNNQYGVPNIGFTNSTSYAIDLLDRRLAKRGEISGGEANQNEWIKDPNAEVIGKARVYDWSRLSKNDIGGNTYDFELRLLDVQGYTKLTVTPAFGSAAAANAFVEGKYSGASGYIVTGANGQTSAKLQDVKGQFQVNEPLMINGNDNGRSVTAIDDYDVSNVKSVHSNPGGAGIGITFIADTVLDRKKEVFDPSFQFDFNGGTVRTPGISDFRGLVKVGDILSYTVANNSVADVRYNRVTQVTASTLTVGVVTSISGICDGSIGNCTPTGVKVLSCDLEKSVDPGYIIPLENPFVSSVNVKDSSYIARKQLTATASGGSAVFNLSDTGDDDLTFEPFTSNNYVLNLKSAGGSVGTNVNLRESQTSITNGNRTLTITGLTNVAHDLTAAVKRTTLASKKKDIVRCHSLVIDGSRLTGSGTADTTFKDGLSPSSNKYGARVQDKEICLNYPDIHRVLGVFESNDASDPDIPKITVDSASASDVFTNNVTVGEQFIGNNSGALARVASVDTATELSFVYENQKEFENGETITLKTSGIVANINLILKGDRDISRNYDLDTGSRPEYLDYGRIIRKNDAPEPSRKLRIIFDYYSCDESIGTIQTINSYNGLNYTSEIPSALGVRLSDTFDIRPRVVAPYAQATSPFCFANRDFTTSTTDTLVANQSIVLDYTHYLGRIDRLYLTNEGVFQVKKGEPAINPKAPLKTDGAFEVGIIKMQPYTLQASRDVRIKMIPHKRYTMKDIGGLESRIKTLEEYTTLSLLETDTKNLAIKDPNTGLDKFKSGFFVDNFRNHASHNFNGESKFDIDIKRSECRPKSTERNVSLVFETKTSNLNPLSSDYRFVDDFDSDNLTRNGPGLTLKYTEDLFINQPLATRVESLNPFALAEYHGTLELTPSTDYWIDEIVAAPQNIDMGQGTFAAFATILGIDDRENGGMSTGMWNSTEEIWGDVEVVGTEITTGQVEDSTFVDRTTRENGNDIGWWGVRDVTDRDITTVISDTQTTTTTFGQSGIERETGLELSSTTETVDLGPKITSIEVLFNCRSRNIEVSGTRLKPNTKYYVFMEQVDVTNFCVPKLLPITMTRGSFSTQDIITTAGFQAQTIGQPDITFRAAQANHKFGPFNAPTTTYATEPYSNTVLTNTYSSTSKIINVDTFDLADFRRVERLGYVSRGMVLTNQTGTAEATVEDLSLMSDDDGNLLFSLHIPDPSIGSNPRFTTGMNTIKVTTSPSNASILDPGGSSASTNYLTSGQAAHSVEQTLSIKTPQIERFVNDQPISRITGTDSDTVVTGVADVVEETVRIAEGEWFDPLAQSFVCPANEYPDGLFVTSGEIYFKAKDESDVTIQIRELDETGRPSQTIIPFGQTKITPDEAVLSEDGSVGTVFTFESPVYLRPSGRYALTLITPLVGWNTFITRMNEVDLISGRLNDKQPSLGSLFRSQNSELWTESQYDDLKFKLNKAKFVTNTPSSVIMYNHDLAKGTIRKENPVTAYSRRQILTVDDGSGNAITSKTFSQGKKITQQLVSGSHTYVGRILASGGPLPLNTTGFNYVTGTGTGIEDLPDGNYTGVTFTSLTGYGDGAVATVAVASGAVTTITITTAGSGYRSGDLAISGAIGTTGGSGIQVIVNSQVATTTNKIIVEDIDAETILGSANVVPTFASDANGSKTSEYSSTGSAVSLAIVSVTTDAIRDGYTFKVDHKNHGMHSNTNQVQIENFVSDFAPVTLSTRIDDNSTIITLSDITNFTEFEGKSVGTDGWLGYIKVGKEIISYSGTNNANKTLTGITREVDGSLRSNHSQNEFVYKYEFNKVSLRKINKTHPISNLNKTFDSYHIRLTGADATKVFSRTTSGGGKEVKVSQNIPFEAVTPKLNVITPTGTDITSRIKSTSGTSLSGTETPFTDIGYENVTLNKYNELDSARLVASKINEYTYLDDNKSFALELVLNSKSEHVSPLIDLNTANIVLHSNLVDSKVTDYVTDSGTKIPGSDPNTAIYETKRIDLDFPSNSIYVQFDGHKESDANFRVFYKLYREDSQDADQHYVPFNTNGLSDKIVNSNNRRNTFSEHKYTAENISEYNAFMIKVVMTSTNQAQAPRLKNFRAIALRSYNID